MIEVNRSLPAYLNFDYGRRAFTQARTRRAAPRRLVVAPTPPTPPVAGGLKSWVRMDFNTTLNGSNLSAIGDISGNNNNFKQTAATQQPAYKTTGGANNQAYIQVTGGSTQVLDSDFHTSFTPGSIWVVCRPVWPGSATNANLFGSASPIQNQGTSTSTTITLQISDGSTTPAAVAFSQGSDAACQGDNSGLNSTVWKNNSTSGANSGDATTGFTAANYFIAGAGTTGANDWNGFIYEVMMFDHVLSSTDRTTLQNYAHTRYGI